MRHQTNKRFSSQRKRDQEKLNFGFQSTYIALLVLIGFLLLYYVWITNANATQSYNLQQLRKTQKELKVELSRLKVQIDLIDNLDTITSGDVYEQMKKVEDPNYLVIREGIQYVYNH